MKSKRCKFCNDKFELNRVWQLFCSKECSQTFRNNEKKKHTKNQIFRINFENNINNINLSYFAGILDGEGCIRIGKHYYTGEERFYPRIIIGMTDKKVIEWVYKNIGGKKYEEKTSYNKRKKVYSSVFNMREGAVILKHCLPYLIVKKEQAELFLDFYKTSYHFRKITSKERISNDINIKRKEMFLKMKKLNKKGI